MRPTRALRGLSAFFLALYLGAGFGVPLADAFIFHSGRTGSPQDLSLETDHQARTSHDFCRLAQHAPDAVTPATVGPVAIAVTILATEPALRASAPRDAAPAGLPASRAPPLA